MNREYHRWYSARVQRDMELLVFGHAGAKVLVFPTRAAPFHEYEDLRVTQFLANKINDGHLQLFCVDSYDADSLYAYWKHPSERIRCHIAYEEYILNEVLPFMHSRNHHPCTISHGCSLGAYHATNIAFRHPQLFQKLAAFSGRFDLTLNVESFRDLFDGYYDDNIYFNNPSHYIPNLTEGEQLQNLRKMDIIMVIGEHDPFLGDNQHISRNLWEKGVWNTLHIWNDRAHQGYYWRRMAQLYL